MNDTKKDLIIPDHELILITSRAGGPGGQHVNKTDSKVTLHWNITETTALNDRQKQRACEKLKNQINEEGILSISCGITRSQNQNRQLAYKKLIDKITKALHVPKKRIKTALSAKIKQKRLLEKKKRGQIKKLRSNYE